MTDRPLITFALFAYNQERFIREAVEGALAQTYSPLQIILSDDCSSDRTFEVMQELEKGYSGPHTILLNRNERNLGLGGHVNRLMELADGELVVAAAGDDISLPERTRELVDEYLVDPENTFSVSSRAQIINADGNHLARYTYFEGSELNGDEAAYRVHHAVGCAHAWHKRVFEFFGKLDNNLCNEDIVIGLRSYLLGGTRYLNKVLVYYRTHDSNLSNASVNINNELDPIAGNSRRLKYALQKKIFLIQQLRDTATYEIKIGIINKTKIVENRIIKDLLVNAHYIRMVTSYPSIRLYDLWTGLFYKHTYRLLLITVFERFSKRN